MTNKHKRSATQTKKRSKPADEIAASAPSVDPESAAKPFTHKAQLAALICLAIGISKLMQFSSAVKEGSENPETCMSYMIDETTCKHPSFGSLVLLKYYSGLSLTAIVAFFVFHLWFSEGLLVKFMTCIFITPLNTTALAAALSDGMVKPARVWHLIWMSGILLATSIPSTPEHFPFLNERSWSARSMQSMCLISLALLSLTDISRAFSGDAGMENALFHADTPLPYAARSLVYFWIVDKLSMALLFAFAVVHLPAHKQRSLLFAVSIMKFGEYFFQLPKFTDTFVESSTVAHTTIVAAVFAGIAWFF